MFFFIAGNSKKLAGEEVVKINRNGTLVDAQIKVFRNFITIFFIPLIPIGKNYSIYIPETGEYYEDSLFSKIPADLLEKCKDVGRRL